MAKLREEITNLISSLSAENFRLLIQRYLQEKYDTKEIFIVDGPYDGGLDLEIRKSERIIKRNVQITIQKDHLEKKVKEDLAKSKENVEQYSYLSKLDFYCNQKVTYSRINNLRVAAETDFEIDLNFYDANMLAQEIEIMPAVKSKLFELLDIRDSQDFVKIDRQTKVIYDMLSNAQETGEMKKQFVLSFLFTFLYSNPGSTIEQIVENCSEKLGSSQDIKFYRDNLSVLKSRGIIVTDSTKKLFSLSPEKASEIETIYAQTTIQENQLKNLIEDVLKGYNLVDIAGELADFLTRAYKANYMIDVDELLAEGKMSVNSSVAKIISELKSFLRSAGTDEENTEKLTKELLKICHQNEYLNKVSASILFANLYESNRLDDYLSRRSQYYYLDTQVLLRLICYQYNPGEYDDLAFNSVKNFYETVKSSRSRVELATTYNYLMEVAAHFQEALKLQRFFELPAFTFSRKSRNVFSNYYHHLLDNEMIEQVSMDEFFGEMLGINIPDYNDPNFTSIIANRIKAIFQILNIDVFSVGYYEHFQIFKKEYELQLAFDDKFRANTAVNNDIQLILYLSDLQSHLDDNIGIRSEPFLVTWDKEFYTFRRTLMEKFQSLGYGYWYIYSPSKLADRLSVVNFKLNPTALDYNIISLTENNFNLLYKTATYADVLSYFFEKKDLSELQTANKLLKMEAGTQRIDDKGDAEEIADEPSDLTKVLLSLKKHYGSGAGKFNFEDLVLVFENNDLTDKVMDALLQAQKFLNKAGDFDKNTIFDLFDSLITINISNKENSN